nr:3516_t:CDS:2 [Entrophospora candida]
MELIREDGINPAAMIISGVWLKLELLKQLRPAYEPPSREYLSENYL